MSTASSRGRNSDRFVDRGGYVFNGHGIDEDWIEKARELSDVAVSLSLIHI